MRNRAVLLVAPLLLLFLALPAVGQTSDTTLNSFSAYPDAEVTQKFDLTQVDFTQPVPADYQIGAGDVLVIDLGNIAGDQDQQVISPQGDIFIPAIGKVGVSGMTIPDLTATLTDRMKDLFRNYHLTITVGRVRKIQVKFTGMVQTPGTYIAFGGTTLSHFMQIVSQKFTEEPLNTAVPMAEFASRTNNRFRALLPEGSFRRIEVYRKGELFKTADLAKLLVTGDSSQDLLLDEGDQVHIPSISSYVVFDESVPFTGKMELLPGDTLPEIVKLAGGPENFVIDQTVEVQKGRALSSGFFICNVSDGKILDVSNEQAPETGMKPASRGDDSITQFNALHAERIAALPAAVQVGATLQLEAGDLIRFSRANDAIYLTGAWGRPGVYVYRPDWTVMDYIGQAGGFWPNAQEGESRWIRKGNPGEPLRVQYVSLKGVMTGKDPMPDLQPGDMLYVPTKNNQWSGPTLLSTLLNFGTQLRFFK